MPDHTPDPLEELDRQVERASLFTHASFDRIAARSSSIDAKLSALIEVLRANGTLGDDELVPEATDVQPGPGSRPQEPGAVAQPPVAEAGAVPWPAIALRQDLGLRPAPVEVNCAERMHVCHAVCCKLSFALTAPEVDAGVVRFDLGFPYMIRHDADGYCTHNDRATGFCGVYQDRPGICGKYSCAGDTRIWKDFEAMELNHEWLDENLGDRPRIRLHLDLPSMEG